MACTNCTQSVPVITGFIPSSCMSLPSCGLDASCVVYTGPALSCSGIATNDTLDAILQKIDPLLCAATGDYSTYNTFCLAPISTQQEFVESISDFVCTLRDDFDTFTGTTFPDYQSAVNTRFIALEVPGITCASAGVTNTMTLQQVLNAYCTKFGSIDTLLDVSGADWNSCYVVSPLPTNPQDGFDALITQICLLKAAVAGGAVLPTFNNVGSCLPAPLTTTDTLVSTINKIKTRLCQTGTIDTTTITWGCVTQPSGAQNLQGALQNIVTQLTSVTQTLPTVFSADFVVTNVNNGNLCLGKHVALAVPSAQDRFVASDPTDVSPATLQEKVTAGTNITLDFASTPGQMIINSTAVASSNYQVKINVGDTSPGYLDTKLAAGPVSCGVQVTPSVDVINEQIVFNISIDPVALLLCLIDGANDDPGAKDALCTLIASCPSPCDAPTNVQVVYQQGTTTTSTTTTTTTTP